MTYQRHRSKIDDNQRAIVKALRQIPNLSVEMGHDDIMVGHDNKTYWYEIKSPKAISKTTGKPLSNAIKPSQLKLLAEWKGHYKIVSTLDEILEDMGITLSNRL